MKLIFKYTLKNIRIKPVRTVIMILCLTAVSLAFSLCLTINITSGRIVEEQIRSSTGKADIMSFLEDGFKTDEVIADNTDVLYVNMTRVGLQLHSIENYKYVQKKQITVLGLDSVEAYKFGLIPECEPVKDDEIIITSIVAAMFGYEKGDSVLIPCVDGSELVFTVKDIIPCENFLSFMSQAVIVTSEKANEIMCNKENTCNTLYIDVTDDTQITNVFNEISQKYPDSNSQQIIGGMDINEMISGLRSAFFAIFAVVFLMVIFIVSGFAKNIVTERMPVVGTLRSIGADKATASMALLMESFVYGILGGMAGGVIFYIIKDMIIGNVVAVNIHYNTSYDIPLYIPFVGAGVTVIIGCACSVFAIVRTAGQPVRDIIFANKDTCYNLSLPKSIIGVILLIASVVLYMIEGGFIINLAALACFEVGICFLIPVILKAVSKLAEKFSRGGKFPVLRLSLIQSGTKRASVSGAVLCTSVISLTAAVFILAVSVDRLYSVHNYSSDIIISGLTHNAERYESIKNAKGITDSEMIYYTEEDIKINNSMTTASVFGYEGFRMFSGIHDLPETIESGTTVMDGAVMRRLGISVGDNIEIILKSASVRPKTLKLKVVGECDSVYYDMRCNAILLNMEDYKSVYHDYPSILLLKTDDGSISNRLSKQLADESAELKTAAEYYAEKESENSSVTMVLYCLIFLGIALMVISIAGNQSISFELRKREFAILHSSGMCKKQLAGMIIGEMGVLAFVASIISVISGGIIVKILSKLLEVLDLSIPVYFDAAGILIFIGLVVIIMMIMSIQPICSLMRMNTADRLKYE